MKMKWFKKDLVIALVIIFICSFIIISPQIYKRSIILGTDVMFHLNRFFETAKQLETGKFNYFLSLFSFNSSGRIVNAFYGWDFSYLMGFLLMIVKSWTKFQIVSSFICTFIAGTSMYFLSRYLKLTNILSIITAILYMSSYVVMQYPIAQAFNGWGAAFLPLIFISAMKSIKNIENPINYVGLSVIVSLLLSIHMMTLVIALLAILPFYMYSFIRNNKKVYWVRDMLFAVGLTILLSANSILGFLDPYLSNNILKPFYLEQMSGDIVKFLVNRNDLHDVGLIYTFIFIFGISFTLFNWKQTKIEEKFAAIVGGVFLLLASGLLPWDELPRYIPFVKVVQFPHRFVIVSYVLLILNFAMVINRIISNKNDEVKKVVYSLTVVLSFFSILNGNAFINSQSWLWQGDDPTATGNNKASVRVNGADQLRSDFKSPDLEKGLDAIIKGTPDYLPIPKDSDNEKIYQTDPYKLYLRQFVDNPLQGEKTITNKGEIKISWENNSSKNQKTQLPVAAYSHSYVRLNGEKMDKKEVTDLGALIVNAKPGLNEVVVGYRPIISIKLALVLKFIGLMIIILLTIKRIKKILATI
ncbi:glycosyltransferase family protein [Enterococcus lactis]|uniref:hypothetical protein n=1 Tax=Enterococcus lactis TaxID=357441 RepID=UPI00241288B6|nr:hypothetical protein [Enterococcus lactis]